MQMPSHSLAVCPIVIGRSAELTALRLLTQQAKDGKGSVAYLDGEAGIGKSRLVAEVKQYAQQQHFLLLQGNCFQTDRSYPYAPLLDLWRSYITHCISVKQALYPEQFLRELSRLLPDIFLLLPDLTSASALPALGPEQEKRHLFAVMSQFIVLQAARQPVLFILEDIHWCDDISLEFLLYLAHRCTELPVQFILTYRSEEVHSNLGHVLSQMRRARVIHTFSLARLPRAEVGAMLHAIFISTFPAGLLETIYTLTEGNPFFIEELLRSLIASRVVRFSHNNWEYLPHNDAHTGGLPVPQSVQAAIQQRTRQLGAEARHLLTLAAVAGRRFNFAVLQAVMQCEESHLLLLMKELMAAQLVIEESAEVFAFRHVLTRQAIYAELLVRERQGLHRILAETIERCYASPALLDAHLMELAYHYTQAEVWPQALAFGERAGEKTLRLYAPHAALEFFNHALRAASHLEMAAKASTYRSRGQAYEMLGEFERARSDFVQALQIAQGLRDRHMEWQCLLDLGFLWAGRDYAQAGPWFREAHALASTLADSDLEARSLNRLGNWLVNTGQPEEGLQAHQEALLLFETAQDTQGMAETLDLLGQTHGMYGDLLTSVEDYGRAIELFRPLNLTQSLISSLLSCAAYAGPNLAETTVCTLRTRDECLRDTTEALSLAQLIDAPSEQAYAELVTGMLLSSFGELSAALAHGQEGLRIASEIDHEQWMAGASFVLGRIYDLLLDPASAIQVLTSGLALASQLGSTWWMGNITAYLALAYLLKNDLASAETLLAASLPQCPRTSPERRIFWAWGELALAQGHPDEALNIADTLLASSPGAPDAADIHATKQPIPWLLRLKGEALIALQRAEEAVTILKEAERGTLQRQEYSLLWRIHRTAGYARERCKQHEQAEDEFGQARKAIAYLAATVDDASRREQFSQAALATLPDSKPASAKSFKADAWKGLTRREREVALLIAQEKFNREIAEELVISERTVESHVANIMSKLQCASRRQIALWIRDKNPA